MRGRGGVGGGGMWNVAPEAVGRLSVTTVCLDHGLPEPRPSMQYEIRPLSEYTDKPEVHEVVRQLSLGNLDQRVAQLATWHFNNDMSWEELAAQEVREMGRLPYPMYHPMEIRTAMELAFGVMNVVREREESREASDVSQSAMK